jgi:hypothetical protein
MNLFRNNKTSERAAGRFSDQVRLAIAQNQRKAATWLSRKTQYWNRSSKIIALVLFCIVFGGCCLFLLLKAFIH